VRELRKLAMASVALAPAQPLLPYLVMPVHQRCESRQRASGPAARGPCGGGSGL
jgi:hypothetical protein